MRENDVLPTRNEIMQMMRGSLVDQLFVDNVTSLKPLYKNALIEHFSEPYRPLLLGDIS